MTAPMGPARRWRVPTVKRLVAAGIVADAEQGRAVRRALLLGAGEAGLYDAAKLLDRSVEWIGYECTRGTMHPTGLWIVNTGETYDATLYVRDNGADFTPRTGTVHVGAWGDVVEAHERRCARCERALAESMR